jgi:hypothetical protein
MWQTWGGKECRHNFGAENLLENTTWNIEDMRGRNWHGCWRNLLCGWGWEGGKMELGKGCVQWQALALSVFNIQVSLQCKIHTITGHVGQKGSGGIALLFLWLGNRWDGWSTAGLGRFTPGKENRYPFYRRLGGPQSRSGRLRKNLAPTESRSSDRPTRSESLYRLCYPGLRYPYKDVG